MDITSDHLVFPRDLEAWRRWERSHHRLRRAKTALVNTLRPGTPETVACTHVVATRGTDPKVLIAVDAPTSSQRACLLAPAQHLNDVVVLCPHNVIEFLPGDGWSTQPLTPATLHEAFTSIEQVVAVGHYLPLSHLAWRTAQSYDLPFVVIQHGLLTPFMAPLPPHAHLYAYSAADAEFWISGRTDVTYETPGLQIMWEAANSTSKNTSDNDAPPLFLGQLHGTELGRHYMEHVSRTFCLATDALYRPHPSEKDRLSRMIHALWRKRGIHFDTSGRPLVEAAAPVVSVFSTGVLEMAARGVPTWVYAPGAPSWLQAFHERYNMKTWGDAPSAPPAHTSVEPAAAIARGLVP